ncbi:MAG: hypothetical protein IPK28_21950 [Devosia sp.]|nr:hypothetical protein [Devosia sp.]
MTPGKPPFALDTEAEKRLVAACRVGGVAHVAELHPAERAVHPRLIRWLCEQSANRDIVSVRGIRLDGARIDGDLDLDGLDIATPLWLDNCQIGRIDLQAATIAGDISMDGSSFTGVDADRARIGGRWFMNGAKVKGRLNINSAVLNGQFNANGASFDNAEGDAIHAHDVKAAAWFMNGAKVKGRLNINSAVLDGPFSANGATFDNEEGDAIRAHDVKAAAWFMNDAKVKGRLNINSAVLNGQFNANGATFDNEEGDAIRAQGVKAAAWFMNGVKVRGRLAINSAVLNGQFNANGATFDNVGGDAILAQGVKAAAWFVRDAKVKGRLAINSAVLDGPFSASGASFDNVGGDAIYAQGARAADWFMNDAKVRGRLAINSAVLDGQFNANGATFDNAEGDAIHAQDAKSTGWFMDDAKVKGRLNINSAVLNGQFNANGATFDNAEGDAIHAQGAKSTGWFMRATVLKGTFAFFGGQCDYVDLTTSRLASPASKLSIICVHAKIGRLCLPNTPPQGGIDLSRATIDTIEDHRSGWPAPCEPGEPDGHRARLILDGTTYENLEFPDGDDERNGVSDAREREWGDAPRPPRSCPGQGMVSGVVAKSPPGLRGEIWQRRVRWLMSQGPDELHHRFNPQPWKQLERTLVKMGYEQDARHIAVERHAMQRRADHHGLRRSFSLLLHILADYGFNPWKTVGWSLAMILLCGFLFASMGGCGWNCTIQDGSSVGDFFAVGAGNVFYDAPAQKTYPSSTAGSIRSISSSHPQPWNGRFLAAAQRVAVPDHRDRAVRRCLPCRALGVGVCRTADAG